MTKPKPKVWVVELWHPHRERWEPTVGCGLTLSDARDVKRDWSIRNPDDRFRLAMYRRHPA